MLLSEAQNRFFAHMRVLDRSLETISGYGKDLRSLSGFLQEKYNGPCYAGDVTRFDIEQYLLHLKDNKKLAPASRSRALYTLLSFFKYLHDSGAIRANPTALISAVKVPQKERSHLTGSNGVRLDLLTYWCG